MLKIALPTGRLQKGTLALFRKGGINIPDPTRKYWAVVSSKRISRILWVKPQLVPEVVKAKIVDVGFTGIDCYEEWYWRNGEDKANCFSEACFQIAENQEEGIRLALIAKEGCSKCPDERAKVQIFTEFPFITKKMFPNATVVPALGSVEALVPSLYPFGVTVVDTGGTLDANGLEIVKVLRKSTARFVVSQESFETLPNGGTILPRQIRELVELLVKQHGQPYDYYYWRDTFTGRF